MSSNKQAIAQPDELHTTELMAVFGDITAIQNACAFVPGKNIEYGDELEAFVFGSLRTAQQKGMRKVAFTSVILPEGEGSADDAARIAVHAVRSFLQEYPDDFDLIEWVIPDKKEVFLYTKAILGII